MNLKVRPSQLLALALALLALAAGCGKDSDTVNSPGSANSNSAPASASPPASTPATANTSPTAAKPAGLSPTEAVRGYYEAGMRKDVAGVKRLLSRQSLQLLEEIAERQGKTLDQLFTEAAAMDARKSPPEFSNERIDGDTAFVDIKTQGEPLRTMPLVKEEGEWKLAFGQPRGGAVKR